MNDRFYFVLIPLLLLAALLSTLFGLEAVLAQGSDREVARALFTIAGSLGMLLAIRLRTVGWYAVIACGMVAALWQFSQLPVVVNVALSIAWLRSILYFASACRRQRGPLSGGQPQGTPASR